MAPAAFDLPIRDLFERCSASARSAMASFQVVCHAPELPDLIGRRRAGHRADADLLLGRILLPDCPSDVADKPPGRHGVELDFYLGFALWGYDEPEIRRSSSGPFCRMGA